MISSFIFFFNKFIYYILFLAPLGFTAARGLSPVAAIGGPLFLLVRGLLTAVASPAAEHGL